MRIVILLLALCFTTTASAAWKYKSEAHEMSDEKIKTATIQSSNTIDLGFPYKGPQRATFIIRSHPEHGLDAIIYVDRGQMICDYESCTITARFDNQPATQIDVNKAADHSSNIFFVDDAKAFIELVKSSKKMKLQVMFYSNGNKVFNFNTSNLKW